MQSALAKIAAERLCCHVQVVGDMDIAMQAAFGAGAGVIVIAGTGSVAFGRDAQGNTARAGGWGFAISDEGSGCNTAVDFSQLFPPVLAAADTGDTSARAVLMQAGGELANLAKTVLQRLFPAQADGVPLAMVGGVFRQSALVRQVF